MTPSLGKKIIEAKQLGWEVTDQSFTHPHNNDYVEIFYFRSTRMRRCAPLHSNTDLKDTEARCVSNDCIQELKDCLSNTSLIGQQLHRFFLENPTELHHTPRLTLTLNEEAAFGLDLSGKA